MPKCEDDEYQASVYVDQGAETGYRIGWERFSLVSFLLFWRIKKKDNLFFRFWEALP
jgi:hypothetical protein